MKVQTILFTMFLCTISYQTIQTAPDLTAMQLTTIGNKIWQNESGQSKEKLTWWLQGEDWASLGIGHFIWYPQGIKVERTQTFPDLLTFLKQHGIKLPRWLEQTKSYCPWKTKDEFFKNFNQSKMIELREFLASTIDLQTQFIIERFSCTLSNILAVTKKNRHVHISTQYHRVANSPNGLYALIDYVNFKGEGINKNEQYNNQGWGLLQILENMNGTDDLSAITEFTHITKKLLTQRVNNCPQKNEERFLPGWKNRVNTYIQPL